MRAVVIWRSGRHGQMGWAAACTRRPDALIFSGHPGASNSFLWGAEELLFFKRLIFVSFLGDDRRLLHTKRTLQIRSRTIQLLPHAIALTSSYCRPPPPPRLATPTLPPPRRPRTTAIAPTPSSPNPNPRTVSLHPRVRTSQLPPSTSPAASTSDCLAAAAPPTNHHHRADPALP